MIAVIDYGVGNLGSVLKAFQFLNVPVILTSDHDKILKAQGVVLPGVGAFGAGMKNLKKSGLNNTINEIIKLNRPFLGICLGLQLLFSSSEENPGIKGLDIIKGKVTKFKLGKVDKIPHMGWNQVEIQKKDPLFVSFSRKRNFYFVHSYYVKPENQDIILGTTSYCQQEFASVIRDSNIWAIQCHPEKSSKVGLEVLNKFSEVAINGT